MWIKINGLPIQVSSIKNISKIEQISEDMIIKYYNKSSRNRFYSSDDISESSKIQYVNKYITSNNKSTGNVINYLKKEDGSDDYDHIIKSTFKLNCDIFIFYICAEEISYSEGKCNLFNNNKSIWNIYHVSG